MRNVANKSPLQQAPRQVHVAIGKPLSVLKSQQFTMSRPSHVFERPRAKSTAVFVYMSQALPDVPADHSVGRRLFRSLFRGPISKVWQRSLGKIYVKMGNILLDLAVKIRYSELMVWSALQFVLRISLIALVWVFVWRFVEPKTHLLRILRAALLVLSLLAVLAVIRIAGA